MVVFFIAQFVNLFAWSNVGVIFAVKGAAFLKTLDATIIRAPQEDGWAPGYYSILFEDPDGVRLELNFVPGKGVFGTEAKALKPTYPESKLG